MIAINYMFLVLPVITNSTTSYWSAQPWEMSRLGMTQTWQGRGENNGTPDLASQVLSAQDEKNADGDPDGVRQSLC
jgi:hypothetical protein